MVIYHVGDFFKTPSARNLPSESVSAAPEALDQPPESAVDESDRTRVPAGHSLVISSLDRTASGHIVELEVTAASRDVGHLPGPLPSEPVGCYPRMINPSDEALRTVVAAGDNVLRRFCAPLFANALSADRFLIGYRLAVSRRVHVFVEESLCREETLSQMLVSQCHRLCYLAETEILDRVAQSVCPVADPDADGKLTILVCSLTESQPALSPTGAPTVPHSQAPPIHGCVRETDFSGHQGPFTGDIVYLNLSVLGELDHRAILSHEITHAALFSAVLNSGSISGIPGWLNEAIAHVVELDVSCFSPNLSERMHIFKMDTARVPLILNPGFASLTTRRGPSRAAGCLFISWLLQTHPEVRLVDFATTAGEGAHRIEVLTGSTFRKLFDEWATGLSRSGAVRRRHLFTGDHHLMGTAFVAFQPCVYDCNVQIRTDPNADLKVSVVPDRRLPTRLTDHGRTSRQ